MKIRQTDADIATANEWIAPTRHFIQGEAAVKRKGKTYLPPSSAEQPTSSYKLMKDHTIFFPATSRTQEGLAGLIFRKPPVTDGASPTMDRLLQAITSEGDDIDTLAYNFTNEMLATNFTGLLVDMPAGEADANLGADALVDLDQRPFINVYTYENIIAREYQTVRGRKTLTYVRLDDGCVNGVPQERELRLVDGEYWVQLLIDGVEGNPFQPLRNGKPLTRIPFFLDARIRNGAIEVSPIGKVAALNLTHYRNEGLIAMSKLFQASPQGYVLGVEWPVDPKTNKPFNPTVSPGTFWTNPKGGADVKIGYLEYSGKGLTDMRADRAEIAELMAITGARIIAGEKIAAEAPETLAIRRASENSALATLANMASKTIEAALNEMADWMGLPHVKFQLNTDFLPQPLTAAEIQAHVSMLQAGILSGETVFLALRDGDVVNPTLTWDVEKQRLKQDQTDGLTFIQSKSTTNINEVPAELPRNDKAAPLA